MSKRFYPAVFQKEDVGYSVFFPDLKGCFTQGDTLEEAYKMAADALGLYLEDSETGAFNYPETSEIETIKTEKNQTVVLVEFDEVEYRKRNSKKSVKKTLSIPQWLNIMAEEKNINFSQILQKALKAELNI